MTILPLPRGSVVVTTRMMVMVLLVYIKDLQQVVALSALLDLLLRIRILTFRPLDLNSQVPMTTLVENLVHLTRQPPHHAYDRL